MLSLVEKDGEVVKLVSAPAAYGPTLNTKEPEIPTKEDFLWIVWQKCQDSDSFRAYEPYIKFLWAGIDAHDASSKFAEAQEDEASIWGTSVLETHCERLPVIKVL